MNRKLGIAIGITNFLVLFSIVFFFFRPYPEARAHTLSIWALVSGIISIGIYFLISRISRLKAWIASGIIIVGLAFILFASAQRYGGTITHAQFGLVVYRIIPIPYADITVSATHGLELRKKSHSIQVKEITSLEGPYTELYIIGIGWNERAKVVGELPKWIKDKVVILPNQEAIKLFNEKVKEQKEVALLLHTTC